MQLDLLRPDIGRKLRGTLILESLLRTMQISPDDGIDTEIAEPERACADMESSQAPQISEESKVLELHRLIMETVQAVQQRLLQVRPLRETWAIFLVCGDQDT